jgi:hypothetical protein
LPSIHDVLVLSPSVTKKKNLFRKKKRKKIKNLPGVNNVDFHLKKSEKRAGE